MSTVGFHVTEDCAEAYLQNESGMEFLQLARRLRDYLQQEQRLPARSFVEATDGCKEISRETFDALARRRMENTGEVSGLFELDFDARTFSALNIMDGWKVYAMQDIADAAEQAFQEAEISEDARWRIFLDRLDGRELTTPSRLTARNFYFEDSIEAMDDRILNFYVVPCFNVDEVFGTFVETDENDHALNVYANYDMQRQQVCDELEITLYGSGIDDQSLTYHLNAAEKEVLREKMEAYNNAAAWRKLLISQQNKFSEAFHIPASALHWYAAYHDADTHPHIHMMIWTDQETVLKRDAVVKLRSAMTNSIFQAELENLYIRKDAAYKDVSEAAREVMRELVDRMESVSAQPASIQQKLLELALELRTVSGKKQYGYLKKSLKDKVDEIVDELEKLPEVAAYYAVWNGLRDTLEGYYKNRPRQHNPLSQQKEFRAIKNAIIQEADRLRQQMEQESSQEEEPSPEETSTDASTNSTLASESASSTTSYSVRLPSEYLLNSTIRLFRQMGQIFRDNAAPPSNPMGIRIDSKRRKKLMQKRLVMGHKQDDHEQNYGQTLQ